MRVIANNLHVSVATVSEALRGSKKVNSKTQKLVIQEANRLGYKFNPSLGAAMSALRHSKHLTYKGTVALVDAADNEHQLPVFHKLILQGANKRAQELGLTTELFWIGSKDLSMRRLKSILTSRGIFGLVVLPFQDPIDFTEFSFDGISAVSMDYSVKTPLLHTITPEHHLALTDAIVNCMKRGYQRPGLFLKKIKDSRLHNKWTSSFLGIQQELPQESKIPVYREITIEKQSFLRWISEYNPDVIIGHDERVISWLSEIKITIPRDIGFVKINTDETNIDCAGIEMLPRTLGATAIEAVLDQQHRGETGPPITPKTITIYSKWIEGPTIKASTPK